MTPEQAMRQIENAIPSLTSETMVASMNAIWNEMSSDDRSRWWNSLSEEDRDDLDG